MLLGRKELIAQARRIRKSIGGGMRQAGVLSDAARVAVEENLVKLRRVHDMAKNVGKMWKRRGGNVTKDVETNQVWLDLHALGIKSEEWNEIGINYGVAVDGPRLVLHHQISEEAIRLLGMAMTTSCCVRKKCRSASRYNDYPAARSATSTKAPRYERSRNYCVDLRYTLNFLRSCPDFLSMSISETLRFQPPKH
jgi:hypothetical protein